MGTENVPKCIYSEALSDVVEHIFFSCDRWLAEKDAVRKQIGDIAPSNAIGKMLRKVVTR